MNRLQLSHHCISLSVLHESHLGTFPLDTACNTDNVNPECWAGTRNLARSDTVTIPTTFSLSSIIGSLRTLFFNIISTTFPTVVEGFAVIIGCDAKLSSNVLREYLLTRSLSVTIPNAFPFFVMITLPTCLSVIKVDAWSAVLETSNETMLGDIILSTIALPSFSS